MMVLMEIQVFREYQVMTVLTIQMVYKVNAGLQA
jgi:hypothetical protein